MNDLEKILASMQIEIQQLKARVSILTRELNTKKAGDIGSSARKIPIFGETYYIDSNGDAYFRNLHYVLGVIGTHYRMNEVDNACVIEYSATGTDPWTTAFVAVEAP